MKKISYLPLTVAILLSSNAMADTATGTLIVKAAVLKSCAVNTPASGSASSAVIDFGNITSLSQNVDGSTEATGGAKLTVLCTNTTPWNVTFNTGTNPDGTQRRMVGGSTEYIPYNLYSDATRTTPINAANAYSGTGNGQVQAYNIYGRIPAGTTLPSPGAYIDTVVMTVTY